VTAGAKTARLEGHSHWVAAQCMLPDGRLASVSWDNTIRLWDVTAGAETACLETDAPIHCVSSGTCTGWRLSIEVCGPRLARKILV
jgi:WD40 repeat protein